MKHLPTTLALAALCTALLVGCSDDKNDGSPAQPTAQPTTCLGCHSDQATLELVADPNPPPDPGEGGCGGELPEMEAWLKVYIGGPNGEKFLNSAHGKLKCIACHGGTEPASEKNTAHQGEFIAAPSKDAETACGGCHPAIAANDKTSLHTQGFGQKAMVSLRSGFPSYENFPDQLKKGYDKNCGKCHASCGECHVMRPRQAQGGFLAAHDFKKSPDMRLNCTACHSARVANAYFGEAPGTKADVHFFVQTGRCTTCHTAAEMHGDGNIYTQRYALPQIPKCENCHGDKKTANTYHNTHWDDISCQGCHSQQYQQCSSCHVDTGVRDGGPYFGFKIGMNPLPSVKRFKYVVLRNAPASPDTWSNYGIPTLANFDAAPTFRLASPHSTQRWTKRTQVGSGKLCFEACHIKNGANEEWFLFQSDLKAWEVVANKDVVVDSHLPSGWK